MRKPHQILAFPYIKENGKYLYAIFLRNSSKQIWQGIAGVVEDDETFEQACKREAKEEAGIIEFNNIIKLESTCTIPIPNVTKNFIWGEEVLLIYEHCYGIEISNKKLTLSKEHTEFKWVTYEEAMKKLKYDSNKNALWELNYLLTKNLISKNKR